jgi:hypothetical protein
MHYKGLNEIKMDRTLSLTGKNLIVSALLGTMLLVFLANTIYGASIYNSDLKPQRVQIEYKDGSRYVVTVYNSSTHYFDCVYGCQVTLVRTGYTRTLDGDLVVIIDDGKLRVR